MPATNDGGESQLNEANASIETEDAQLRRTLEQLRHDFSSLASYFPHGFQFTLDIMMPRAEFANPNEVDMSASFPVPLRAITSSQTVRDSQSIGLLNITGFGTDEMLFDYHSVSGGIDFQVHVGTSISVEGVDRAVGISALNMLLQIRKNMPEDGPRLTTARNLEVFDREGNPKLINRARRLSSGQ